MCQRAEISLPCEPASVGRARHWALDRLARIYERFDVVGDDVEIVVSEFVTNAVQADARRFTLALEAHHRSVRVEATDDAPGIPTRQQLPPDAPSGRGLALVDVLSTRWGVEPHNSAKTVWAELAVPDGARPSFDCAVTD